MPGLLLSLFHAGEDIDRISWSDLCAFMQKGAGEPQQGGMSREGAEARHSPHCYLVGPSAESVHLSESSSIMPMSEAYSSGAVRSLQGLEHSSQSVRDPPKGPVEKADGEIASAFLCSRKLAEGEADAEAIALEDGSLLSGSPVLCSMVLPFFRSPCSRVHACVCGCMCVHISVCTCVCECCLHEYMCVLRHFVLPVLP